MSTNLHGFYNPTLARKSQHQAPVERPDLVAERNAQSLGIVPYKASQALEFHVMDKAPQHIAVSDAPDTWTRLKAFNAKTWTGPRDKHGFRIMPVYNGGCDNTIYSTPAVNYAFRAWHDSLHLESHSCFNYAGEKLVAKAHVRSLHDNGLSQEDQDAIWFDTYGQNLYYLKHKRYIENQALFVAACFKLGIGGAIDYVW